MAVAVTITRTRITTDPGVKSIFRASGSGVTIHRELGRLLGGSDSSADFTGHIVTVAFDSDFTNKPIGWIDIYRYRPRNGKFVKANVLINYDSEDWLTISGFSINIDASESIDGIILEYYYTE